MSANNATPESLELRALLRTHAPRFHSLLKKYGAPNPQFFGSVARGDATTGSDIGILVEMNPNDGDLLMHASGLLKETRTLFGKPVDIFPAQLLKHPVSKAALQEAVAL